MMGSPKFCWAILAPDVVVIGAGKIGATVAGLLASTGDYQVILADRSPEVFGNLDRDERIRIMAADVEDSLKLVDLLNGQFAVLNAAPFRLTKSIAEAARAAGTHYLDLTEDVVSTRRVRELAANANTAFFPQCGLAPGFVSIGPSIWRRVSRCSTASDCGSGRFLNIPPTPSTTT